MRSIYDADTIRFDIDLGFGINLVNQIVRLYGIDAWELRGEEREKGLVARDAVIDQFDKRGPDVILTTYKDKKGKYGRWLATVGWEDGLNLNDWLVAEGHAETASY